MKPINEKERTLAFVQFLVLFILTIILTIFFVFFDFSLNKKQYRDLKDDYDKLKSSQISSSDLPQQIDSLQKIVEGFSKLDEFEYKRSRDKFLGELKMSYDPQNKDTSALGVLKTKFYQLFNDWSYCVGSSIAVDEKTKSAQGFKADLEKLEKQLKECSKDFEEYKRLHL